MAQSFGDDTETGVTNVRMLIEVEGLIEEPDVANGTGHERAQTGIDTGGGGGIGVVVDFS